jgi:hypothetical protein
MISAPDRRSLDGAGVRGSEGAGSGFRVTAGSHGNWCWQHQQPGLNGQFPFQLENSLCSAPARGPWLRRVLRTCACPPGTFLVCAWKNCEGDVRHCGDDGGAALADEVQLLAKSDRIQAIWGYAGPRLLPASTPLAHHHSGSECPAIHVF